MTRGFNDSISEGEESIHGLSDVPNFDMANF